MRLSFSFFQKSFSELKLAKGRQTDVTGFNDLANAGPEDATFYVDDRYRDDMRHSKAAVLITSVKKFSYVVEEFPGTVWDIADPLPLLYVIGTALESEKVGMDERWTDAGVHATAIVESGAQVHPTAGVGPYCVVRSGAVIGANVSLLPYTYVGCHARVHADCVIGPHASVLAHTEIDEGARIMAGAVIGSKGFSVLRDQNGRNVILPQVGRVKIGKHCRVGANATIDRAAFGETVLGDRSCTDNLTQIGHNARAGTDTIMCSLSGLTGSSRIGDRCTIAALAGVKDHVTVTDDVAISAFSGVSKDVTTPHTLLKGAPAMPIQQAYRLEVYYRKLPELFKRVERLQKMLDALSAVIAPDKTDQREDRV